jgi:hypothetical protein
VSAHAKLAATVLAALGLSALGTWLNLLWLRWAVTP